MMASESSVRSNDKKVGLLCITRNSAEKLRLTLDSIVLNTDSNLYDLYVVDNGSTDSTSEIFADAWPDHISFIRNEENLGWVAAINSFLPLIEKYQFVGFIHDDIEVGSRWLQYMVDILDSNSQIGAVGPLTSNERDWQGYDVFRLGPIRPGLPELEGIKRSDVSAMSSAMSTFNPGISFNAPPIGFFCVLLRTEVIKKAGYLDPSFNGLYWGENEDYCKRITGSGYQLALSFKSYVAHHSLPPSDGTGDYEERCSKSAQIISQKEGRGEYRLKDEIPEAGDVFFKHDHSLRSAIKLIGLYVHSDTPHLEENHSVFAAKNGLEYRKYKIHGFFEKWALVYHLLETHPEELFVFIDSFSYFVSEDLKFDFRDPIIISELHGKVMDNFFVVRSCNESRKVIHEILSHSNHQFVWENSHHFEVTLPPGIAKPYGFLDKGGRRMNLDLLYTDRGHYFGLTDLPLGIAANAPVGSHRMTTAVKDLVVARYGGYDWPSRLLSFAEILCHHRPSAQLTYQQAPDFEIVNPGKKHAVITLSSLEPGAPPPDYVAVSEPNLRKYALNQDITLYIYKGIPSELSGIHSTWTKPYLVIRHLSSHEYVSWLDADILISRQFSLPEGDDVIVFSDPSLFFNAGFMTFRKSDKTTDFLNDVISRCERVQDRSGLHLNGGDQRQFIEAYQAHFPDSMPRSYLNANTHPALGKVLQPASGLWHFMGINPPSIRAIVMDFYDRNIVDSEMKSDRQTTISLLHATRGRARQAIEARGLWIKKATHPERIEHIFAFDVDDESSECLKQFRHVIQHEDGFSVGAWNLAAKHSTGDILIQMSDDWDPPSGWDQLISEKLDTTRPLVLWVNEGYTRDDIMCMAVLTRKYYEKTGLFDPRFKNVYSDDDFTARARNAGVIVYAKDILFKHKHFTTGDSSLDATYLRGNDPNEYHRAGSLFEQIHRKPVVYSQNDEQTVIDNYFGDFQGIIWDFGCNDGMTLSNSYHFLSQKGWSGILVDASEACIMKARERYKGREDIQFLNIGLAEQNGELDFYESGSHLSDNDMALLSSFNADHVKYWESSTTYQKKRVRCYSFKTFHDSLARYKKADCITIDVEGLDYAILSAIDLSETATSVVCVEYNNTDPAKYIDYCRRYGLRLISQNNINLIFAK